MELRTIDTVYNTIIAQLREPGSCNLEAEAVVMVELITMDAVMAGLIIEVITTTNTISFIVMIMTTFLSNMAHPVHYVVATITPPNIVLREKTTLTK